MNKALERLKIEAASLGANGILIVNTDNKTYQSINSNKMEFSPPPMRKNLSRP